MYVMSVVEYAMLLKRMILKNSQLAEVAKGLPLATSEISTGFMGGEGI